MARKKTSMALFEAMSRTREKDARKGMAAPGWMGRTPASAAPEPAAPAPVPVPPAPAQQAMPQRPVVAPSPVPATPAEPAISTVGARLRFSLNYTGCVGIAAVGIVLLAAAFGLGRWTGTLPSPEAQPPPEQGSAQPPAPGPRQTEQVPPSRQAAARQKGKYYLVIQALKDATPQQLKEAERIAAFCKDRNEQAEPYIFGDGRGREYYAVWSLTPFDSPTDSKALQHAQTVEMMGKEYFAKNRTYSFQQRRTAGGKLSPWFVQY